MLNTPPAPPATKNLLILTILCWLLSLFAQKSFPEVYEMLVLRPFGSPDFMPYQLLSYMFLHDTHGIFHILFNMLMLWMFGTPLEYRIGTQRFLILYFAAGIGAGILQSAIGYYESQSIINAAQVVLESTTPETFEYFIKEYIPSGEAYDAASKLVYEWAADPESSMYQARQVVSIYASHLTNTGTVGASGAVFGIMAAFGLLFAETQLMLLIPPIPIKAKYLIPLLIIMEYVFGITGTRTGVAHFAHIGGAVIGAFLVFWWYGRRR